MADRMGQQLGNGSGIFRRLVRVVLLVDLIARLVELDDLDPLPATDPVSFEARVDQHIADHVQPARVKALDEMGEGRREVSIAMGWVAPKLG